MFDWLIPLLIVIALLIWILDYVGLLDAVEALFGLLGLLAAAVVGTVASRRASGPSSGRRVEAVLTARFKRSGPRRWQLPSPGRARRADKAGSGESRKPRRD